MLGVFAPQTFTSSNGAYDTLRRLVQSYSSVSRATYIYDRLGTRVVRGDLSIYVKLKRPAIFKFLHFGRPHFPSASTNLSLRHSPPGSIMAIPAYSMGDGIFSPQFAFLSLHLLKSRPKNQKRESHALQHTSPSQHLSQPTPLSFPSEILHIIFCFAMEPSSDDIDLTEKNTLRTTILTLIQICQQWRLAAHDCPRLWVHSIDIQRHAPEIVAEFLQLSRSHLIDVGHRSAPFRVANARDLVVFRLLRPECRRIREWNLVRPKGYRFPDRVQIDSFIFPLNQPFLTVIRSTGRGASLLSKIGRFSPTLRKLFICDLRIPIPFTPSMKFTHLTELAVVSVALHVRATEALWLSLLQGMPQLRLLALHDAILLDPLWHPFGDVELPQLRLLSLQDSHWHGVCAFRRLFSCLHLPGTCGVDLKLPPISESPTSQVHLTEITELRRILRRHLGGPALMDLSSVDIPQVHFGVRATVPGRCVAVIGSVQDPDTTFDWNSQAGTSGVIGYLDEHKAAYPRFPPLSISLDRPSDADFDLLFLLAQPLLQEAVQLRIHSDPRAPHSSLRRIFCE